MLLATAGVVVCAVITALAAMLLLDLDWRTAGLLGAIVGSTDAAAVFALLTRTGITLNERVAATLEIESGINDPMAVYLTLTFIALASAVAVTAGAGSSSLTAPPEDWQGQLQAAALIFAQQFGWGTLAGLVGGVLMAALLKRVAPRDISGGILALLVGAATAALAQRLPGALGGRAGPAQLLCALSLGLLGLWHERAQERAAAIGLVRFGDDWAQRIEPVGKLLKVAFGPHQPLLATCAAGALPYWSELPALDPLGLTNAHIARQRLRPNQQSMHGHEAGDTAYVVAQRPDIFLFCAPRGGAEACLPQEEELLAHPAVQADYVVRWVEGHDPMPSRSGPLFSLTSERIGIQRSEAEVLLPGWLFADDPAHPARLDAAGRLVLRREAGAVALLDKLPVRGPRWRATVETTPPGAAVAAEVVVDGARRAAITLRFDAPATVVAVRLEAVPADEAAAGARPADAPTAAPPAAIRASSR
jgi:hypothetical protein